MLIDYLTNKIGLNKKLKKEIIWSFASKGSAMAFYFLINIIIARIFSVEMFGIWSLLLAILEIVFRFSYFGINLATQISLARDNLQNHMNEIISVGLFWRITISLIISFIFWLSASSIAAFLNKPELTYPLEISSILIFFMGMVEFLKSIFVGVQINRNRFYIELIEYGGKFSLVVICSLAFISMTAIIWSFIIATSIAVCLGLILLFRFQKPLYRINIQRIKTFSHQILSYGFPLFIISIAILLLTELDTVMLGVLSSNEEVGYYGIAKQIAIKLPHIAFTLNLGVMPIFANINNQNRQELQRLFRNLVKGNTIFYGILCLSLILFSPVLIPLVYGKSFTPSVLPMQLLCIYIFLISFNTFFNEVMDYQGKMKLRALYMSSSIILNIIFNYLLIPKYGAVGAACATSLSVIPFIIFNIYATRKILY